MKYSWFLAVLLLLAPGVKAQNALPAGTLIPAQLDSNINVKVKPGQQIRATVMQNIPGTAIRKGARVLGTVVEATPSKQGVAKLELRFDSIQIGNRQVSFTANIRALASPPEVEDAQTGDYGPDAGISFEQENTHQIGGEEVYGSVGPVKVGSTVVGRATGNGVLAEPREVAGERCRGIADGNSQPQAMWLFSSDACGVYGFTTIQIEHAGRTDPRGEIVLSSEDGKLNLNSGSGLLLRVHGS